ncbi:MAG: hypothetical protein JWQ02_717 [Capsulimonas sp.]|jgi:hypothetical protein|nr:hypothetical protein [Capsulimonas sp.]
MALLPVFLRRALTVTAVFSALGFAGAHSAQAEIVVSGSNAVVCPPLQAWCEHHIPRMFQPKTRVSVRNLSDRQMAAYLAGDQNAVEPDQDPKSSHTSGGDDDDIDGIYENGPPRITLRIPKSGAVDMMTFTHEYGHYVWFNLISKNDRNRYEKIYKRQAAANHLVTRYAATDLEEGFAEAFSFYVNQPQLLERRDSVSSDFFRGLLNAPQTQDNDR